MENLAVKKCLILFMILASMVKIQAKGFSQGQNVSLEYDQVKLGVLLTEIEEVTNMTFLYNVKDIDLNETVSLHQKDTPLDWALNTIFADLNLDYKIEDDQIVLFPVGKTVTKRAEKTMVGLPTAVKAEQQQEITGTVTDGDGVPLPGVNITIDGTSRGAQTDFDGNFSIEAAKGEVLHFSFVGFEDQTVQVGDDTQVDIALNASTSSLDEVIVIGYGTQRREDVTSAISAVDSKSISKLPIGNATDVLKGKASGLSITANSGEPGSSPTVRVRGITSFGSSNDPLYVVDGIQVDNINWLNQSDIENMQILKDGASAAIYGVSAAAGVVVITTKQGRHKDKIDFSYNGSFGIGRAERKMSLLNATQYATIINESYENDGYKGLFDNPMSLGEGTDWQKEIFHTAKRQSHNFSVSGGNEKSTYYGSFGYLNEEGIVQPSISYQRRLTMRLNSTHQIFKFLKFGENVAYTHRNFNRAVDVGDNFGANENNTPLNAAVNLDPVTPVLMPNPENQINSIDYENPYIVRNKDGIPYGISPYMTQDQGNPKAVEQINRGRYNSSDELIGNAYAELSIEDFTARSSISGYKTFANSRTFTPLYYYTSSNNNTGKNNLTRVVSENFNWSIENTLNYKHKWNKHDFNFLLGQGYYESGIGFEQTLTHSGLPVNDYREASFNFDVPSSDRSGRGIESINTHKTSYFGRVIYNFDSRYLFTGTFRRDGSSRFGPNNTWGNFPSFSVGWRINNEAFWRDNEVITDLKLRGGYGILGNDNIGEFQYASFMVSGANYTSGDDKVQTGYRTNTLANPDLRWEKTSQADIGLDVQLFKNLDLTLEWFNKKTTDILRPIILPGYVGLVDDPVQNVGTMSNKGIEVELGYNGSVGDLIFSASGNFSYIKNKVERLEAGREFIDGPEVGHMGSVSRIIPGQPFGTFYGYDNDGIFQNQAEVDAYVNANGDAIIPGARPGDFRWVDTNGDGQITSADRINLGNSVPKYMYGINLDLEYKNFDLNIFAEGKGGNKIMNAIRRVDITDINFDTRILGRWTGEGTSTTIPRVSHDDPNENLTRMSRYHLTKGDYFRMKRIQLGYTLPKYLSEKILANDVRFYISTENLFTITKYDGYDPEIAAEGTYGIDNGYYPQSRQFIFGININF